MPELRPLRGVRYSAKAGSLADLVAPPYDVISPEQHAALCQRSPHNVVRLILGERSADGDAPPADWHRGAATLLAAWQRDGLLVADAEPAFYLYTETFRREGTLRRRKLLLGALRLQPYGQGLVFPHEKTNPGPKADRLRLMKACRANLSPILAFFPDGDGAVDRLLQSLLALEPTASFTDDVGIGHELRRVADPGRQAAIAHALAPLPLYIADGHHRYETCLTYRDEERAALPHAGGGELPCDFTLAACMSGADPGLVIRPTHRVVSWEGARQTGDILDEARKWFHIERLSADGPEDALGALASGTRGVAFVIYGGKAAGYALLELSDQSLLSDSPYPTGSPLRQLAAAVFTHAFLMKLLDAQGVTVVYTPDASLAVSRTDERGQTLACLLPGVRPAQLMAIVNAGGKMPPKSTYFWPKPMTGMLLGSLETF